MKRKVSIVLLFVAISGFAYSQRIDSTVVEYDNIAKARVNTNAFKDNWFIAFGAGTQIYFGDHDKQMKFKDRWTPAFDIAAGKWFTPAIGTRIGFNGFTFKGVSGWSAHSKAQPNVNYDNYQGFITNAVVDLNGKVVSGDIYGKEESGAYDLYKTKINYLQTRADILLNMSNIIGGYKRNRIYSFIPYVGIGWMTTFNYSVANKRSNEVSASLGLLNSFRLSEAVDFNFDVRGSYLNDRFDGQIGGRWGEGPLTATLGLTYKFKKRGWDRPTNKVVTYSVDNSELLNKIKDLEKENLKLKDQLAVNTKGEYIIDKKLVAAPQLTIFPINKSTLSDDARVNLGFMAKTMNLASNVNRNYIITGYADRVTGTDPINVRLSRERAQAVFNCLVNEFGISPERLKTDYEGGVDNMFYNDPRLSRAAIVTASE